MTDQSDDDLEIEIVDETEAPAPAAKPVDEGIAELRAQLDAERARRIEADRRATEADRRAYAATVDKEDSDLQLVTGAIETLQRDNDLLQSGWEHAMRNGDHARAAQIQKEMSSNEAKLVQLNNGREAMINKPKPQAPQPVISDPVEAFASQLSIRSAEWVRAHPQFVTDQKLMRKMIAAHELAIADGIAADSDEYFASIEDTLRVNKAPRQQPVENDDASSYAAKVVSRRDAAPAAAPVSRGTPTGRNSVKLSAAEREMAEMMGMAPEEYAKNKIALQKEGKLQ